MNTLIVWLLQFIIPSRREWYANYYLRSNHWLRRARRARREAGYKCQRCRRGGQPLDVHHRNYRHLFFERRRDLLVLCRRCHNEVHHG